jgi:hypothetical protein
LESQSGVAAISIALPPHSKVMERTYMECGVKPAQAGATPLCEVRSPLTFGKKHKINKLTRFLCF